MNNQQRWPRAIILIDMNAFFASIEQLDNPRLKHQPVAVTNGEQGTCIITSSYEARAYGIKTGMRLKDARKLCPSLVQCPARPERYAAISSRIMDALTKVTPDIEVYSVDEAFLDVSHCQDLWGSPIKIAHMAKRIVYEHSSIHCSIGLSGDKTTAKYAAKLQKPKGFTIIPPWEAKARLSRVPVTHLCGINKGIARFLADRGVITCGDMEKLPIGVLAKRFGNPGRRIWYMCLGQDPEPVHINVAPPKTLGHGKVMPPNTRDISTIFTYLSHMSEKLAQRLRRHQLEARHFSVSLRSRYGWLGGKSQTSKPTNDGSEIMTLCRRIFHDSWHGEGVNQVSVVALDPKPVNLQLDLFSQQDERQTQLNQAMDKINERYGEFTLAPGRLLARSKMPNAIAPAWKPFGHRKTV